MYRWHLDYAWIIFWNEIGIVFFFLGGQYSMACLELWLYTRFKLLSDRFLTVSLLQNILFCITRLILVMKRTSLTFRHFNQRTISIRRVRGVCQISTRDMSSICDFIGFSFRLSHKQLEAFSATSLISFNTFVHSFRVNPNCRMGSNRWCFFKSSINLLRQGSTK